jgi:tetratricopeptide (TPR) repeat protein
MAWTILDEDGIVNRDLDLALTLAQRADEAAKHENPTILDTLARAYFEKGDVNKAIETQTRAVALLDDKSDPGLKRDLNAALQRYKSAKK